MLLIYEASVIFIIMFTDEEPEARKDTVVTQAHKFRKGNLGANPDVDFWCSVLSARSPHFLPSLQEHSIFLASSAPGTGRKKALSCMGLLFR